MSQGDVVSQVAIAEGVARGIFGKRRKVPVLYEALLVDLYEILNLIHLVSIKGFRRCS